MSGSIWTRQYERKVDQRGETLPPCWVEVVNSRVAGDELGTRVHISGKGRRVARRVIELVHAATEMAVISTFLLADTEIEDALLSAATRGVRVYVMLASEARLGREDSDGEFDRRVLEEHKKMLNRLAGHVLFRSAPHFHAKVAIVDPQSNPQGVLLTSNLTKEALDRNEELAVDLTTDEVQDAVSLLGWAMWETAEHEMVDPKDRFRAVKPLGSLDFPEFDHLIATTPKSIGLSRRVLEVIDGASDKLFVASFGWGQDHPIVKRLIERAEEGVEVIVLARIRPSVMPTLVQLAESGAKVFGFRWLHAKAVWCDQGEGLVMSANFQADGFDRGFELGVELKGDDAEELHSRLKAWTDVAWRLEYIPTLGSMLGTVKVWNGKDFEDIEVLPSIEVSLGDHVAESADNLSVEPPHLPSNGALPRPAHEVICKWTVSAPTLHRSAKELFRTGDGDQRQPYVPPVYKDRGRTVVAVRNESELRNAVNLLPEVGPAVVVRVRDNA